MYVYNRFLRPLSSPLTDTNIQITDINGIIKHTINPWSVLHIAVSNNILVINLKGLRSISIPFSTINESKLAISLLQEQIDILKAQPNPTAIDPVTKTYIDNQIDNIPVFMNVLIEKMVVGTFSEIITQGVDVLGGFTFSKTSFGDVGVALNGIPIELGATISAVSYFSIDGGLTANNSVELNSVLYINPSLLFDLDSNDIIIVRYITTEVNGT